ncbi:MAG: gamma-glutamyl-gamma-aminobutyrate hydrolase family protein [Tannerella sp.]|jgi:putative glutamine amidotransferase|nr:gamma-glutamyl-gamma-aminobutyrate hydrolase family protein [Tannerella sp.]
MKILNLILLSVLFSACIWKADAQRRPVIGISDASRDGKNAAVPRSYIDAVLQAGGIPVVIPLMSDEKKVLELLYTVDGIVFAGGGDFDPAYYHERSIPQMMGTVNAPRDEFEMKLVHLAAERSIPVLGICRGLQLINIAFGGSLYQDLPAQYAGSTIRHRQKQPNEEASHAVYVEDNTVFADIVKERMLMVNSSHHQAIKKVARGFRVAGKSPDEIVEVIEKVDDENWILGVQFHPEARVTRDHAMLLIFQRFIDKAGSPEKPDRTVKTVSAPGPQIRREPDPPAPVSPPQIIHQSVIDTQFIYKFVRDTQYIYVPADTVYLSVADTKYIRMPADTVYVSDTVYLTASPLQNEAPPLRITDTVHIPDTVRLPAKPLAVSDTLIFTPGTPDAVTAKPDTSKSKKNEEKREAEEKQKQYRKEQMEKAKQQKKLQKEKEQQAKKASEEKKEQEKKAKKEQAEKDRRFRQQQKENAKRDKQELKKMEEDKKPEDTGVKSETVPL